MSSLTLFVGLDYHQAFVQVCVMNRAGKVLTNRRCDNSAEAIVRCVEAHGEEVAAAIEACCGAGGRVDRLRVGSFVGARRLREQSQAESGQDGLVRCAA
jgi:hypothetical protein